ncbi:MAG: hypothetical protein JKY56_27485 [Kofleriaceae bacterium]|nr:hypothetical protein [Kofleriaceae bacterium]
MELTGTNLIFHFGTASAGISDLGQYQSTSVCAPLAPMIIIVATNLEQAAENEFPCTRVYALLRTGLLPFLISLEARDALVAAMGVANSGLTVTKMPDIDAIEDWAPTDALLCAYPLAMLNWLLGQTNKCAFLGRGTNDATRVSLEVPVVQSTSQHGEVAHTLRHQLRGGCVQVEGEGYEGGPFLELFSTMHAMAKQGIGSFCSDKPSKPVPNAGGGKINHSDLHFTHVSDDPVRFMKDLVLEACFPKFVTKLPGYGVIEEEAQAALQTRRGQPVRCDVIYWHRGDDGRRAEVDPRVLKDCLRPAKQIMRHELRLGAGEALLLGDAGCDFGDRSFALQLPDLIAKKDGAYRSQLNQVLMMSAVVRLCGARIVVGIRSGLIDRVALTGGIACCQLADGPQERLEKVLPVGMGMGRYCDVNVKGAVSDGITDALLEHLALSAEVATFAGAQEDFRLVGLLPTLDTDQRVIAERALGQDKFTPLDRYERMLTRRR